MAALRTDALPARTSGVGAAHAPASSPAASRRSCSIASWHHQPPFQGILVFIHCSCCPQIGLPTSSATTKAASASETATPTTTNPPPKTRIRPIVTTRSVAEAAGIQTVWRGPVRDTSVWRYCVRGRIRAGERGPGHGIHVAGHWVSRTIACCASRHRPPSCRAGSISCRHCPHLLDRLLERVSLLSFMSTGFIVGQRSIPFGISHDTETHSPSGERAFSQGSCSVKSRQVHHLLPERPPTVSFFGGPERPPGSQCPRQSPDT